MRPVNLIPRDGRRGAGSVGAGRGIRSYAIVGALALILAVVSLSAVYEKRTDERKAEVDDLQSQISSAQAEASSLSSFTSFRQIHDDRVATIDSLAKSRFDWERVMRELAIVVPDRVWLMNLTGTASPAAVVDNGAGLALRGSIPGPALELTGCAANQRTVARLIAAVNDIDGVTRVLVSNSAKPEPTIAAAEAPVEATTTPTTTPEKAVVTTCAIRSSYPSFELVAAFDDVAPPADPAAAVPPAATPVSTDAAATPTPEATTTPETPATEPAAPATDDGGVAATTSQNDQQQGDAADAQQGAQDAAQIPTGGNR